MAAGKVLTGFSKPYVAIYSATGGVVTYARGQILARGVEVSLEPEIGDDNTFYADNIAAENVAGIFTGGTATLTVDGLLLAAEQLVFGLPATEDVQVDGESVAVQHYGDAMEIPYVGIGFVARYLSGGVESYTPIVLTKARFEQPGLDAATQEDSIEFQTQELTAALFRDDTSDHDWLLKGADQTTEAAAENVIKAILSIA